MEKRSINDCLVEIYRTQGLLTSEEKDELAKYINKLEHHKDTTVGLWATDRPDLIKDEKEVMFQISY